LPSSPCGGGLLRNLWKELEHGALFSVWSVYRATQLEACLRRAWSLMVFHGQPAGAAEGERGSKSSHSSRKRNRRPERVGGLGCCLTKRGLNTIQCTCVSQSLLVSSWCHQETQQTQNVHDCCQSKRYCVVWQILIYKWKEHTLK
jgi:hypothetical protein